MAETMTIQDLRNMVNGHKGEDRISTLPDELIHHIFSFLEDAQVAVKTCVLSKRWVNLWATLPYLDLYILSHQSRKFISQFFSKRNPEYDTTRVKVMAGCVQVPMMRRQIIDYASSHNVKHLHIHCDYRGSYKYNNNRKKLSFPVLQTLHLSCFKQPLEYWSMPSLTILHLEGKLMHYTEKKLNFEGFHNLKELTLMQRNKISNRDQNLMIKSPNLECLTIWWTTGYTVLYPKFVISAPKLSTFKFHGSHVPTLSVEGGFPCLKELEFDLQDLYQTTWLEFDLYYLDGGEGEINNELLKKLSCLFCEFRGIKFLKLSSFRTVQVLMEYSKHWPSPFSNLKTLHLQDSYQTNPYVINYLLSCSSDMKIFIEDGRGGIASYNPEEDISLDSGYLESKKQIARSIPSKDTSRKNRHAQTFEHFAHRTGIIHTLGLLALCSSIKELCEAHI